MQTQEHSRLADPATGDVPQWYKWGPYVAERAWGTVREDYSWNGDAWSYFPFDIASSKVYRWGEDGIAGWCDRYQVLVFAPAFWNGQDSILKERLFGLSSYEGNHGEDVKECYYYLDGTPTHSYMKYLYKYPHSKFPYDELRQENARRSTRNPEYELIDTGIFSESRYFDIFIEYAKASSEDICIRIEVINRGDAAATLHILPHLWFRNQWAWGDVRSPEPTISNGSKNHSTLCLLADDEMLLSPSNLQFDYHLGKRYLYGPAGAKLLFTNNENHGTEQKYCKDGIQRAVIQKEDSTNPDEVGTKSCFHYVYANIPPQGSVVLHLRLTDHSMAHPLKDVEEIIAKRRKETDAFYAAIHPKHATADERPLQKLKRGSRGTTSYPYRLPALKALLAKNSPTDCPG